MVGEFYRETSSELGQLHTEGQICTNRANVRIGYTDESSCIFLRFFTTIVDKL